MWGSFMPGVVNKGREATRRRPCEDSVMTSEDAERFIAASFDRLVVSRREDGASFYLRPKIEGPNPNRILRISAGPGGSACRLKLAITSRMTSDLEFTFCGTEAELKRLVEREIALYMQHFMTPHESEG